MKNIDLKILTDIIHEADTSKTEIAKDKWRLQLCKMIGEMNIQIENKRNTAREACQRFWGYF